MNVNIESDEDDLVITATRLQAYLIEKCGAQFLFDEAKSGTLTDRSRCFLVDYIARFLNEIADGDVKRKQKMMAARAAVALFPNFKTETEEGYVSMLEKLFSCK